MNRIQESFSGTCPTCGQPDRSDREDALRELIRIYDETCADHESLGICPSRFGIALERVRALTP